MTHKILLIDDDPEIVESLGAYLTQTMGYLVVSAPDGEYALDKATREPFDLCIIGVNMPGISGGETYRRLKSLQPGLEVIFISDTEATERTSDFLHFSLPPERLIPNPLNELAPLTRLIIGILGPPSS
jgi:DNA-binding response OmpR family regulator